MFKTTLLRPLSLRHFSSSSARNFAPRPTSSHDNNEAAPPNPHTLSDDLVTPRNSINRGPAPLKPCDFALVKQRIREWSDQASVTVRIRADDFGATTRSTFSQLGSQLNKVTGYEEIEELKKQVVEQETRIHATRQAAREAKTAYDQAVVQRSNSQREVNDLLQRKSNWTDGDVGRFTNLVRQDHLFEQEETRAKAVVIESEDAVDREFSELMRSILARYHEEQIWSDKIRSASTYGSLAALGLNLLVFVMAILVVEPWKRRRLAQTFERKIEEMSNESATMIQERMREIGRQLEEQTALFSEAMGMQQRGTDEGLTGMLASMAQPVPTMDDETRPARSSGLGPTVTASAVVAGLIGWFARTWFQS